MRYRAKPVEKDAWLWTGNRSDLPDSEWASGAYTIDAQGDLIIDTLDGPGRATANLFYAVRSTKGQRYPVRRDIWEENYEAVAEQ